MQGNVKWFDDKKGFGFIKSSDNRDVFVHYSSIHSNGGRKTLTDGQNVEFEVEQGPKGPQAVNVYPL